MTEPIRYRVRWWQLLPPLVVFPAVQIGCALVWDVPRTTLVSAGVLWCVLAVEMVWVGTFGVEVTEDALVMRGVRTRIVPWHRIDWVGPTSLLGTRMVGVRFGGRLWRLRAPVHTPYLGPDPDFEAKARTIYNAWAQVTSAGSAP